MSDRVTIAIARALLSAVDLLLVQGCLELIDNEQQANIVTLLHDFVEHRCCTFLKAEANAVPVHLRKRKTVMLASRTDNIDNLCDMVIHLAPDGGEHDVKVVDATLQVKETVPANFPVGAKVWVTSYSYGPI